MSHTLNIGRPGGGNPLYALEKLCWAVHHLDHVRPLKAALWEAGIEFIKIAERDVPDGELRSAFVALKRDLVNAKEGGLEPTIAARTELDCFAIAERIHKLCSALSAHLKL
jgi:hypothetical protein